MKIRHAPRAFTIIELIVTFSILLIMLGLINFIFRDTQRAVNLGIETGKMIGTQRGVASQTRRDLTSLIGPHQGRVPDSVESGGFLVITQKLIGDDDGANANNGLLDANEGLLIQLPGNNAGQSAGGNDEIRLVRSDQLSFVRTRDNDQPVGPALANTYSSRAFPETTDRGSDAIRIWYGHGLRTNDDGTDPTSPFLGDPNSQDSNPLEWVLARQAIFLDNTVEGSTIEMANTTPAGNYADSPAPIAGVNNYPTSGPAQPDANRIDVVHGLTDYAYFGFDDGNTPTDQHPIGALVEGEQNPAATLRRVGSGTNEIMEDEYESRALNTNTFTMPAGRLRVNPAPPFNEASPENSYQAWQIAQQLPIMVEGCSDFVVEFAADMYSNEATAAPSAYSPDGQVDVDANGEIAWYAFGDAMSPAISNPPGSFVPTKGLVTFPPATGYRPVATLPGGPGLSVTGAFVWRHDTFDAGIYDRMNNTWSPQFSGSFTNATLNDTDSRFCDWPYLIRIRYRLHDARGQIASGQQVFNDLNGNGDIDPGEPTDSRNGVWFEQVFRVNRPEPNFTN